MKIKLKKDKYRKARGGTSKLLDLSCESCNTHLFYYQKDGPGILKRLYLDRIIDFKNSSEDNLVCPNCKDTLGVYYVYPKEKRPAYRLFAGEIAKEIVK
ncbi:hypothetical protein C4564_02720 [Candidatus Microgenomates bacterium]|nr:MAG: hypothetical protein C4564_02720 [Candidatus Microgenomates bacterium]